MLSRLQIGYTYPYVHAHALVNKLHKFVIVHSKCINILINIAYYTQVGPITMLRCTYLVVCI